MKNTLETRLGLLVALAVIAAVVILEVLGGTQRFQPGYHLYALFNNVQDLKVTDHVKVAGVDVGRVENIALDETNNRVRVTMKLRKDVVVRTDSVATIKFTGLMGQSYISLDFGTGKVAAPDTLLNSAETPDMSTMMTKIESVATGVENLTKSFSGEKIDVLLAPLTDMLKANKEPLTMTISNMSMISKQIMEGKGTVGKLIYDPSLYNTALATVTNLQDTASDIRGTVNEAKGLVQQVRAGQGTVGKLLTEDVLYRQATLALTNVNQILQKVNEGKGSVGRILNDKDLYNNAKLTLQKIDKATEGLEDQGPLSVMGILFNNLF